MAPAGDKPNSIAAERVSSEIVAGLRQIGYRDSLLEENYAFPDWFHGKQERRARAAAFGQTPVSYESACIGVVHANGLREQGLVNAFRALGAPILLEVDQGEVREWAVSGTENRHGLIARYSTTEIRNAFSRRAQEWRPEALLRAKNIGSFKWTQQLSLFPGLLPELENQICDELDPLLQDTLSATRTAYMESTGRPPSPEHLFKLVFWILTAKVFHDRKVPGFASLSADPDILLNAVSRQYKTDAPRLLNREARQTAATRVWTELDFRNLSVEVLSQIWSITLVDEQTRQTLGIHRTPRTIVRYILDRIPFSPAGDDSKIVFEPCCGSASFLVGAMNSLRHSLFGATPEERHEYFVRHLAGIEYDPFGVEISTLALTLADFPNPNGWHVTKGDVFSPGVMIPFLRRAGVVLCNPPFEPFDAAQRTAYQASSHLKPAELLNRVLDDLHPSGVLGFVLPFAAIDGRGYAQVRERLAERYAAIELTALPDRAFASDAETALLVATDPIPHDASRVSYRRVADDAESWATFERLHEVSSEYSAQFGMEAARDGLALPALPEVWSYLVDHPRLGMVAEVHRGLEWRQALDSKGQEAGQRSVFVRRDPASGFRRGVAPRTRFSMFEVPAMSYLSVRQEDQRRNAWRHDWSKPKVIFNKSAKSRGHWRIAAFPDREGVPCYQTFFGAWPRSSDYDEVVLAAILNSPVANAFVSTREGKTDITMQTLLLIPMPVLVEADRVRLHFLVERYQAASQERSLLSHPEDDPERILKEIDSVVLAGYRMPPRLERALLDYFRGQARPVSHHFGDYIPAHYDVYFSLSEFLDPRFMAANAGALIRTIESR